MIVNRVNLLLLIFVEHELANITIYHIMMRLTNFSISFYLVMGIIFYFITDIIILYL